MALLIDLESLLGQLANAVFFLGGGTVINFQLVFFYLAVQKHSSPTGILERVNASISS